MSIIFFIVGIFLLIGKLEISKKYKISPQHSRILGLLAILPFTLEMIIIFFDLLFLEGLYVLVSIVVYIAVIVLGIKFFKKVENVEENV